jgi:glycosyltransferase involved in cell wall biosynthesis
MSTRRVLIVGMLDSIHLARWLEQFCSSDIQFLIFPSSHFRSVHQNLKLLESPKYRIFGYQLFRRYSGYFDSLLTFRFINIRIGQTFRKLYLKFAILRFQPTIIHAIEIQHAGYLMGSDTFDVPKRILTNWGSDIYFFQHFDYHKQQIISALDWATHYSAECKRDYELASSLGFSGNFLPRIPNAGGFDIVERNLRCSDRDLIIVKTYGGQFGAGEIAIRAIQRFINEFPRLRVHFYSVTPDLEKKVKQIQRSSQGRVTFSTVRKPLKHEELINKFRCARIYLGCSKSDGLSTSFLEAICFGAYPIQTNTSCAEELVNEGAMGSVINLDEESVLQAVRKAHLDPDQLNAAQDANFAYARNKLSVNFVTSRAQTFYDI